MCSIVTLAPTGGGIEWLLALWPCTMGQSSFDEDSVFDGDGGAQSRAAAERLFSMALTPESSKSVKDHHPLMVSYERTRSSPGDISAVSQVHVFYFVRI